MQAISPAYSTLYDTAPQIIRSCEPHASTAAFVSRDSVLVRTHASNYIPVCDQQYRTPSTRSIHSSSSSNIRILFCIEVLHSPVLHDESSFCNTGTSIPVCGRETLPVSCDTRVRIMYLVRIIRVRTVPCTTYGTAVLVPKYARFLWYLVARVMSFTRDFGRSTDLEYERE